MDKRYLLILIMIIVCCINLSIIVNNSDVVGSASVSVGKYLFSVPEGFDLHENNGNSAILKNNENKITITFECNLSDSDNYDTRLGYMENDTKYTVLSKGSLTVENIHVDTVYYQTRDNVNKSAFYFEKDDAPFKIDISNFNYNNDQNLTLDYVSHLIQSTHLDYKSY